MLRRLLLVTALALAACAAAGGAGAASHPAQAARFHAPAPCGRLAHHRSDVRHLVVIVMENHSYSEVIGHARYLTALAHACGLATNYHSVGHPSLPNYLAMTSGSMHGISTDCGPSACPQAGPSIFSQLTARGKLWRAFDESMPHACSRGSSGLYAARHNPAVYYTRARQACGSRDVRAGSPARGPFHRALHGRLGSFVFVTPNLCDDMHDCPVASGDAWLAKWMPAIRKSPVYRAGHTAIVIVFDEGGGAHVPAVVVSPYTPHGARSARAFSHYSLLHMAETVLGIRSYLGRAARTGGLGSAFNLR